MIRSFRFWLFASLVTLFPTVALAATPTEGSLVRGTQPAVYYVHGGARYAFPNEAVYRSWYADFSSVQTISDDALASLQLKGNMTFKPGTWLIKIQTDPKVYMIAGNSLYWVKDEETAQLVFGADWAQNVQDVADAFFVDYSLKEGSVDATQALDLQQEALKTATPAEILPAGDGSGEEGKWTDEVLSQLPVFVAEPGSGAVVSNLPIPPETTILNANALGYVATSTSSMEDLAVWFQLTSGEWNLLYDVSTSTPIAREIAHARMLNYGRSHDGAFSHRSLILAQDLKGVTYLLFSEINFPKDTLMYPYVGEIPASSLSSGTSPMQIAFTFASQQDIVAWYQQNAPRYGWRTPVVEEDGIVITHGTRPLTMGIHFYPHVDGVLELDVTREAEDETPATTPAPVQASVPEQTPVQQQGATALERDQKRLTDIAGVGIAFALADTDDATLGGCSMSGSRLNTCMTFGGQNGPYLATTTLFDPSGSTTSAPCGNPATGICNYSIWDDPDTMNTGPTITDYRINFWLEEGANGYAAGAHYATTNGIH